MVPHGKAPKSSNNKTKDVKCFRCLKRAYYSSECPTKRIVIFEDNGEYISESSTSEENEEEVIEVEAMECDLLMMRRLLESQLQTLDQ